MRTINSYKEAICIEWESDLPRGFGEEMAYGLLIRAPRLKCQYCGGTMEIVVAREMSRMDGDEDGAEVVHLCTKCGWWRKRQTIVSHQKDYLRFDEQTVLERATHGILKSWSADDLQAPLDSILEELRRQPSIIHHLNPERFEKLVCVVLQEYTGHEAIHVGRSHDGGIDAFLLDTEHGLIPIQVKRRINPDSVEGVSAVREFLGVMYREGHSKGIFISTASRYSNAILSDVEKYASRAPSVNKLELVDRPGLMARVLYSSEHVASPWEDPPIQLYREA